jgi:succinyl-CoA synthetase beta subunit
VITVDAVQVVSNVHAMFVDCSEQLAIVNIIQACVRILRIINNDRATKTIAILGGIMRVVPVASSLVADIKVVQEGMAWGDGALVHEGGTIGPSSSMLEEAVPVLKHVL